VAIWLEVSLDGREAVMVKNLSGLVGCCWLFGCFVGACWCFLLCDSVRVSGEREERGIMGLSHKRDKVF
jgi:hypothetical protein